MNIRRIAAAALATIALGAATPAAAQAQNLLGDINSLAAQLISGADCGTVRTALTLIDRNTPGVLLDENTTRNQLAHNLQNLGGERKAQISPLTIAAIKYSGLTADRALACGIVKQDTLLTGGTGLSSQISDYLPMLSSTLNLPKL
ncbi:hypothetical protein AZH46_00540 [Corynebacterium striatum]|uniref:hypothetical protein n=1 Tax=Corynebacterium striatum TaxID=43770 RepID=UPI000C45C01E|nr:hypothetical protein [Corynebacterium striatum]PIS65641.1 hypothetical protein AZH46_00540 [Corynebacterium striatum]PXY12743.1 hypothetical protein CKF74_07035 [Corynebacterium striatum]PXY13813.1 hypothetical protein CKF62_09465 [Corynebacterium striatum]